ncbi:MAG: hypothetical protein WC700_17515 [Gemmatimonadaceae bacterium]
MRTWMDREYSDRICAYLTEIQGIGFDQIEEDIVTLTGLAGVTTLTNPGEYTVQIGYDFYVYGLSGYIQDCGEPGGWANFTRIEFNIQDSKQLKNMFGQAVNMGVLLKTNGPGFLGFQPPYKKFESSSQLNLTWSRNATAGTFQAPDVAIGVCLHGMKVKRQRQD